MATNGRTWRALWLGAVLSIQFGVPVWQLGKPRPARFGWQMYAGISEPLAFAVVHDDGSRTPVQLSDYLANYRGDIPVSAVIPAAVCEREPSAVEVRYRILPRQRDEVYLCGD